VALIIKILSCNKIFFHGLRSKLPQLFYFKITAQMRTIYVTAQSAPTAGAAESADSP
jgi:hypothetical protein